MPRKVFCDETPVLRITAAEYAALPAGQPAMLADCPVGTRWLEICWGGIRIRELCGLNPDGPLINTYRPIIRVRAVSRLVPRPQVAAC